MAISHKDHEHPNTPAARAACRKQMANGDTPLTGNPIPTSVAGVMAKALKPATLTVVPRTKGDGGVVKGLKNVKRTNTHLKAEHDLADVPKILAYGIRLAWAADLDVTVGERFNDAEKRILIHADRAEIALVWRESNPNGVHAIFVRNWDSSVTFKVDSIQHALEVSAHDSEAWDVDGNLILR
jgi:hypothetical protein